MLRLVFTPAVNVCISSPSLFAGAVFCLCVCLHTCLFFWLLVCLLVPECVARVPVSSWGFGGRLCSQKVVIATATVRNRPQPFV